MEKNNCYSSSGLDHSTDGLRKLIMEHPNLPMLVFAGEECNRGDYSYMCCTTVRAEIGEYLDCKNEASDEIIFTDRSSFEEELEEAFWGSELSEDEFEKMIDEKMKGYEPYWKPVILVYVDN